ncbi:monothiol glutaredoxin-S4, mitochondrial [Setaria italica]|uniref:Glutaredoxin domain-containing protein n=2 Tax=Setaria viridis TaxID=4556 RepID=A0A4U6UCN0_SETVI|nr:monothiol glutaredoxin-S4, mitochondrial [Setaria italica]TKW13730.1 hypothetical protein SEVIR_5G120100v2 [Setaria viridis]
MRFDWACSAARSSHRLPFPSPSPPSPDPGGAAPIRLLLAVDFVSDTMARLVSTALVRGLMRSSRASSAAAVSRPAIQQFMNYSSGLGGAPSANGDSMTTRVAADPDTHQDFQPTSKSSEMSFDDIVAQDIKEHPVLIYMKGYPDAPRCGFSALAVKVLQQYGVPISARDILSDLKLKESVKAYSNWPTFPQVFIKGEFVGGSDIILTMHQKGELKDLLGDIAPKGEQNGSS